MPQHWPDLDVSGIPRGSTPRARSGVEHEKRIYNGAPGYYPAEDLCVVKI
ncbi:hypothetical protein EDWATA_04006 [Edwardsiella tarda ATCC 23685]|uniref:Uncharacterized protein n=1 Tax=Edwardsiella tarda ATCC 23685 TaxID=500638 RepID=D4FB35_EDWTA|nr:hypothetical protein EDWATA_04006 [Edwardsiella tarda ATCC 23685]